MIVFYNSPYAIHSGRINHRTRYSSILHAHPDTLEDRHVPTLDFFDMTGPRRPLVGVFEVDEFTELYEVRCAKVGVDYFSCFYLQRVLAMNVR